ncbi:MAG: hypothetical protein AAGD38_04935 [Acidobacteriota bacterium]
MSQSSRDLSLIATCGRGLEPLLADELRALDMAAVAEQPGAVAFRGSWRDVYRANWRLRTANRVLLGLGRWQAVNDDALAAGAHALVRGKSEWGGVDAATLFAPDRTLSIRATSSRSRITDTRWIALKVKDGLVDGQRQRFGRRSSIDRDSPDLPLRVWLADDRASLFLDTSGVPLDRRGYRDVTVAAPVREHLGAACVLAAGWDGVGPVLDPMCGSATLLVEAAWLALGRAPGCMRSSWGFERLPGFQPATFTRVREEALPVSDPEVTLYGIDHDPGAVAAARTNLERAGLADHARVRRGNAFTVEAPAPRGLLLVNPAYGTRLDSEREQWRRLGDVLKQRFSGWRAVVLAGDAGRGKWIGLRPSRKLSVKNGPLDARILVFDLY